MNDHRLSSFQRQWRIASLILGALVLLWLPLEDTTTRWVVFFALALAALAAARVMSSLTVARTHPGLAFPLAGIATGLLVTPLALFLMAFKSGLHGHGAPDFTPEQVMSIIARTPVWIIAGFLLGLGGLLLRTVVQARKTSA